MFDKFKKILIQKTLLLSIVLCSQSALATTTSAHVENVLGTSLDVSLYGATTEQSQHAIDAMLTHINELEDILSTWRTDSEISQLNRLKASKNVSLHLANVLTLCQQWEQQSNHHFSCRLGQLTQQWQSAVKQQQVPSRIALRRLAIDISLSPMVDVNSTQPLVVNKPVSYDISGVAKGYILDNSIEFLKEKLPTLTGITLDIGGDIVVWGTKPANDRWKIALALHNNTSDNIANQSIELTSGAIAHSGVGDRDFVINRRHFNHILNPHEGWPLDTPHSATVYARDASTADAVATAINTMEIAAAIEWVDSLDNVDAIIQSSQGNVYPSAQWHRHTRHQDNAAKPITLGIDYQIPTFKRAGYERPYVSLWLTDANNKFVRQILLLGDANRWAQENTRWWRRVGRKNESILDALARPTRKPGHYQVQWNGFDSNNQPVPLQKLTLHMEASRENGGHNYRKITIDPTQPKTIVLPAKNELGEATITLITH